MKIEYSYDESQIRRFPEQQDATKEVDEFRTQLDRWLVRKLVQVDRSEKE